MFGGPVNGGSLSEPTEVALKGDAEYGPGGKEIEELFATSTTKCATEDADAVAGRRPARTS